jgi:hypothetical protein
MGLQRRVESINRYVQQQTQAIYVRTYYAL